MSRPYPEMPEPDFRLHWRYGEYKVTKPNVDAADVYSLGQIHALIDADRAAADAEIARLREALQAHLVNFESQHALLIEIGATDFVHLRDIARAALKGSGE